MSMPDRAPTVGTRATRGDLRPQPVSVLRHVRYLNGRDPFLKERLFGLSGPEGNHGEDVKEYWWYADATPDRLVAELDLSLPAGGIPLRATARGERAPQPPGARIRTRRHRRLRRGRWWRIAVDTAKAAPLDLCIRIRIRNAGPETATLDVLPTLWWRNRWTWEEGASRARHRRGDGRARRRSPGDRCRPNGPGLASGRRTRSGRPCAGPPVLRERDQCPASLRRQGGDALPEGRDQRRGRLGRGDRQPRTARDQDGCPLPADGRAGRRGRTAAAAQARRQPVGTHRPPRSISAGPSPKSWPSAREADEFTPRCGRRAPPTRRRPSCARPTPG